MKSMILFVVLIIGVVLPQIRGHGMMLDPPSRSSMWRYGYPVPPNFTDNELFCGGEHQDEAGSNCGVCGDAKNLARPRPNENGGEYGLGIITNTYQPGSVFTVTVRLTANHRGFFKFGLCNLDSGSEDESCFKPVSLADGQPTFLVPPALPSKEEQNFTISLKLPAGVSCDHCVLRWHYRSGNTWGTCEDGHGALGCGLQETFRNCADIAISGYRHPDTMDRQILKRINFVQRLLKNKRKQ